MKIELRADGVHFMGYVNVPGRPSRKLKDDFGEDFVEIIEPGTFSRAIESADNIILTLDHDGESRASTKDGTLKVIEDNVGLRAEAFTSSPDIVESVKNKAIKGWSFIMENIVGTKETRAEDVPIRRVNKLDLSEVSLIKNLEPCYYQTSLEMRGGESVRVEMRATEDKIEVIDNTEKPAIDYSKYEKEIEKFTEVK